MQDRANLDAKLRALKARSRSGTGLPRWAFWVIGLVPVIFLVFGIVWTADAIRFAREARPARGTVVDVTTSRDSDGGVSYTPTIRYQREDGQVFEGQTQLSSSFYDYDIGTEVDVLYSYADPTEVRFDSFFSLYGFGLIFAAFGGGFLAIVLWVRRVMARDTQAGPAPAAPLPVTDPSVRGHVHAPKPQPQPAVRRMR